jgi:tRNA-specific 2-thiouridylase
METVFIAMSGGIDSSFSAYLLRQKGYNLVGITFQLLPETIKNIKNPKACCSIEAVHRAKKIADDLSIPHYVINLREEFERYVIEKFIQEYKEGRTPNPCILCNRYIKFSSFINKALSIGGEKIATGHYAIIKEISGNYFLKKGKDKIKDQSYFLYPINKDLLNVILFPLGEYTKEKVKEKAYKIGWNINKTKESQDICFIPEKDYRNFLSRFVLLKKGPVYLADGKFMGYHNGIHLYTIGQRRGLNIPYREPLYIIEIQPDENTIIVGPKEYLKRKRVIANELNLLNPVSMNISGKVRYRQKEEPCKYTISHNTLEVDFDNPVYSITPGQSVVLYNEDTVVGGGVITSSNGKEYGEFTDKTN